MNNRATFVVYFDGQCNVCNRFVDYCIRHDRERRLFYAPLQGKTARARLPANLTTELSTMVLQGNERLETESTAALHTMILLGGWHRLLVIFLFVPSFLRNLVYRFIAGHRTLLFGRSESCRVPSEDEKSRFLS